MRTRLALFAAAAAIAALSAFAPAQASSWDDRRDWRRVERERMELREAYEARQRALWRGDYWAARRAEERIAHERRDLARAERALRNDRRDDRHDDRHDDRWSDRGQRRDRLSWDWR